MSKNSDIIACNELYEARKANAKATLASFGNSFSYWRIIRDWAESGHPTAIRKDNPQLNDLLGSLYVQVHEPEPCEKTSSVTLSDSNYVAFKPTDFGIAAYFWFTKYNQQCQATKDAHEQGKKDVALQIFDNIASSVGLNFDELIEEYEAVI